MVISWKHCGRLHEWRIKLKTEISARFIYFYFFGLRDQSQYRCLEVMQIHATPSLKYKNVLISNFLYKHCYRDRVTSLREQKKKQRHFMQ